ncbi:MAG: hypothetical protein LBO79_11465 [Zoogloeaceae bacterium]|jgi:hypothetical protein|nr:hypothetical protein [Zoogloeaceae bacterium]
MVSVLKFAYVLLLALSCANVWGQRGLPRLYGEFSCCTDANGQRACGEILPRQCVGRAYTVYNRAGLRIRFVAAPKTEAEKIQATVNEFQQEKERKLAEERHRRRIAIMSTYGSLKEIDRQQTQAEGGLRKDIAEAERKLSESRQRLQALQAQLPPPDKKNEKKESLVPPELAGNIKNQDLEIKYQSELIKVKQKELDRIHAKYENDRKEYRELVGEN